jgi:hypothetical protein
MGMLGIAAGGASGGAGAGAFAAAEIAGVDCTWVGRAATAVVGTGARIVGLFEATGTAPTIAPGATGTAPAITGPAPPQLPPMQGVGKSSQVSQWAQPATAIDASTITRPSCRQFVRTMARRPFRSRHQRKLCRGVRRVWYPCSWEAVWSLHSDLHHIGREPEAHSLESSRSAAGARILRSPCPQRGACHSHGLNCLAGIGVRWPHPSRPGRDFTPKKHACMVLLPGLPGICCPNKAIGA